VDLSGFKEFSMPWEGIRLRFSCSFTNAFNHPSFANPGGGLQGSPGVGKPYSWYTTNSNGQTVGSQQIDSLNVYGRSGEAQLRLEF
jgi:hypothetical protein